MADTKKKVSKAKNKNESVKKTEAAKKIVSPQKNLPHLQIQQKEIEPKPNKIITQLTKVLKISEGQEKFIWERSEPVSGTNQAIYRRDVAGAIIKVNEFNMESEFGWTYVLVDSNVDSDDVNNICAMHWLNASVRRKPSEIWIAKVTGSKDTKDIYNYMKDVKVSPQAMHKLKRTNLFQPSLVQRKKINLSIRKDIKK